MLEWRLSNYREAARECRRKKKEYIKCLENRVADLEKVNKNLMKEVHDLKNMYNKSSTSTVVPVAASTSALITGGSTEAYQSTSSAQFFGSASGQSHESGGSAGQLKRSSSSDGSESESESSSEGDQPK